ncbi:Uncharacterised protein [Paenibacillus thiaminolyticus]|nr:Uncharacterised protein [Paenibacillus thiaminolyticus]
MIPEAIVHEFPITSDTTGIIYRLYSTMLRHPDAERLFERLRTRTDSHIMAFASAMPAAEGHGRVLAKPASKAGFN